MRKIGSLEREERRTRRNAMIIGIFLIIVMMFSVIGYGFLSQDGGSGGSNKVVYNGYEFLATNQGWLLEMGNVNFLFYYNPNEVDREIEIEDLKKLNSYAGKPLYLSSEDNLAGAEVYRNLYPIVERISSACLEGEECGKDVPVKTCEDNFIIIRDGDVSKISQEDNCVFIEGENLLELSDEFLWKILDIRD